MKGIKYFSSLIMACILSSTSYAWWEAGHMLVADIAYANLNSNAKKVVKDLLPYMDAESTARNSYSYNQTNPNYSLMAISHWPDDLHAFPNYLSTTRTWHYIEDAYSEDGTEIPSIIPRDNVVWAINQFRNHLGQKKANKYSRARALAYLVHFVGDIHQPMHCAELHSAILPNGDRGGNSYKIYYKEDNGDVIHNLHALWDSALRVYPKKNYPHDVNKPKDINALMKLISADYPRSYFKEELKILDPDQWHQESHAIAKIAHQTKFDSKPTESYISSNTELAEQRIVLAGYRLAEILNKIL